MRTQFDSKVRICSLENLRAMCRWVSGTAHRYQVDKVSRSRVHVSYSNPDEYGSADPVVAIYPVVPNPFDGPENPLVVLQLIRTIGGDTETWQSFECLGECPTLWRSPGGGTWGPGFEGCARIALDSAAWWRHAALGERDPSKCHLEAFLRICKALGCLIRGRTAAVGVTHV